MCITSKFSLCKFESSYLNIYSNTKVFLIAQLGLMWSKCKLFFFKKNQSIRKEISECSHNITYRLELNINTMDTFSHTSPFVGPELRISFLDKRWRPTSTTDMCLTCSQENDISLVFSL